MPKVKILNRPAKRLSTSLNNEGFNVLGANPVQTSTPPALPKRGKLGVQGSDLDNGSKPGPAPDLGIESNSQPGKSKIRMKFPQSNG